MSNYARIIGNNLERLFRRLPPDLASALPGHREEDRFVFNAFGRVCRLGPDDIILGNETQDGVLGILISLYALHVNSKPLKLEPMKAFKELPDSMPYTRAFASHTEQILVDRVPEIEAAAADIVRILDGPDDAPDIPGDFAFVVRPLPKIALGYIFYRRDEEFPASATCLFSNNAASFLPTDALADVGEYTSKSILKHLEVEP